MSLVVRQVRGWKEVKMEKVGRGVKLSTLAAVQETKRSHEIEI